MGFGEIMIQGQRLPVAFFGVSGLMSEVIGQAKIIPGVGVGVENLGGYREFLDCSVVLPPFEQFFAAQQSLRARGRTAGQE